MLMMQTYWEITLSALKKKKIGLIYASTEVGLVLNTNKTKHMLISCQQNGDPNRNTDTVNRHFENVTMLKFESGN
jgi:hypothetical protein